MAHIIPAAVFYLCTLFAIYTFDGFFLKFSTALINGLAIAILFVIGHDACHNALTPSKNLNRWIARLCFLPSLHPYASWFYSHNILHHGWTNLKGRDPVYPPKSPEEYLALSKFNQLKERLYRSPIGVMLLYMDTIWFREEIFPNEKRRIAIAKYGDFQFDRILVFAFIGLHVLVSATLANSLLETVYLLCIAFIVPFFIWNWLMGFVTYLQHTHPKINWFNSPKEWTFFGAQVEGTAHVEFPSVLDFIILRIMQHTAHHVCSEIPFYRLKDYQKKLSATALSYSASFQSLRETFSKCHLYDYEAKTWHTFDEIKVQKTARLAA
ncbi:MAG: fatty acid desaturase [Pseudomonadota bacterium]